MVVANIVVVGSYVVDLMCRTPHMPKPGETVLGGPFKMGPGGKGGNQAVAAARLGSNVTMVTKVGIDVFGDEAVRNFEKEGINSTYVTRHGEESTGAALIAVDQDSENMIVVALGACGKITQEDVSDAISSFDEANIVLIQLETSIEAVEKSVHLVMELNKPIILNPAPYQEFDEELLKGVTYITPNETEATLLTGVDVKDENSAREAAIILKKKGVKTVIITLGKQGCFVYDGNDKGRLISGFNVDAVDTTGAGDAFNGAFATYIARGFSLDDAARQANAVAALSVTKVGTAPAMPYESDLSSFLKKSNS
ncbi:ribokinase [Evansella tamaricis]|uniref:Ribokinase n=1 Tax=Evansella tamaricis TaxID=2069301 RepID=A0ABS6J9P0_9BACI|nr:ribokinase [Evansella tamaricis]MBU9710401.1 ribokinase [Evansella tamaricis]